MMFNAVTYSGALGKPVKKDDISKFIIATFLLFFAGVCLLLFHDLFLIGLKQISLDFIISLPISAGKAGGIFSVISSTFLVCGLAILIAVPISIGNALYLVQFSRLKPVSKYISASLDMLASIPSIVFGLFGNVIFVNLG